LDIYTNAFIKIGDEGIMKNKMYPFYFVVGALLLYVILFVVPGVIGIYYSFTDWSSYSREINFIGLENFKTVFSGGEKYLFYIKNTLIFTFITTIVKTVLGLLLGLLLCEGIKGKDFHRAVIFMPAILSTLITGLIFKSILNPETGLLNSFLRTIGLGFLEQQWLVDVKIAFYSVMAVDTWKGTGYIMTIILAGLQSISRSYYEAADIDGANFWGRLRYITIPLLMPTITVTTVLNLLYGLKVFDIVYVLTNGGPGYATEVLYTAVLKEFSLGKYGLGTAMSSVLFVFMLIVGYFVIQLLNKEEVE
jgi:raffinose/stachyose/melibiose transport system permease protein